PSTRWRAAGPTSTRRGCAWSASTSSPARRCPTRPAWPTTCAAGSSCRCAPPRGWAFPPRSSTWAAGSASPTGRGTPSWTWGPEDRELDLDAVGAEVRRLVERSAPARLLIELGRYIIAPGGWYLTTVIAHQTHGGRPAVVVDGGSHQRGDLCGLGLRHRAFAPVALSSRGERREPTAVLGCLSLPADVLVEARVLPELAPGDVLAFPNAGAYGLGASPFA